MTPFRSLTDLLALLSKVKLGRGANPIEVIIFFWFLATLAWIALSAILWSYWIAGRWLWPEHDTEAQRELWLTFSNWVVLSLAAVMLGLYGLSKIRRR